MKHDSEREQIYAVLVKSLEQDMAGTQKSIRSFIQPLTKGE